MKIDEYYQRGRYKDIFITDRLAYYSDRLKIFESFLKDHNYDKVLDAGCGDGGLAKLIKEKWKCDVYGADISRKGIILANNSGVKAKVANLSEKIPFSDNFFDLVIANEIIEHLINPDIFLEEIRRILKPGGSLILTTPNLSFWLNRFLFLFGIYPLFLEASTEVKVGLGKISSFSSGHPVGHLHVFNLPAIIELLRLKQFTIEKVKGLPVAFGARNLSLLTKIYTFLDSLFSRIVNVSPDILIIVKK